MANNSQIAIEKVSLHLDTPVDRTEELRAIEAKLTRIIEAIVRLNQTDEWSTLKSLVFDSRIKTIEEQIMAESNKNIIEDPSLYRLQGRLFEARRYDLDTLLKNSRQELINIKRITQPTER